MRRTCDVLVIGGGPAGLSTSITCAREGLTVTLVDPALPPVDKACGEGILPGGTSALRELGVTLPPASMAPLHGIHFLSNHSSDVKAEFSNGRGAGVRRTVLHDSLRARAVEVGVDLCWGSRVEDIEKQQAIIDGQKCEFRFSVIADGQHSAWRERLGFDEVKLRRQRFGFRRHYRMAPWSSFVEVHWGDGEQMYVTPVAGDEVCIALLTSDQYAQFDQALSRFEVLAARVRLQEPCSKLRGGVCATRRVSHVTKGTTFALIGDASGSVDAITGDGISIALHAAKALAAAIRVENLQGYEDAHEQIMRRPRQMGELLIAMDRSARFRAKALASMSRHPEMFAKFLGLHTGAMRVSDFGVKDAMVLGWELLAG